MVTKSGFLNLQIQIYENQLTRIHSLFVCLFGRLRPTRYFSLIWRRHHHQWRATHFDLYSALIAFEEWGFFSVSHLLWHVASVYYGHHRGPMTITAVAECLAVELSLPSISKWMVSLVKYMHELYKRLNLVFMHMILDILVFQLHGSFLMDQQLKKYNAMQTVHLTTETAYEGRTRRRSSVSQVVKIAKKKGTDIDTLVW